MQRPDRFGEEIDLLENATWLTNDGQPKSIGKKKKEESAEEAEEAEEGGPKRCLEWRAPGPDTDFWNCTGTESRALKFVGNVPPYSLPVDEHCEQILGKILESPVVLIQGQTGSGKSLRVPRFLLEQPGSGTIAVAQPRRLPARLLTERAAAEIGEPLGDSIGYATKKNYHLPQKCFNSVVYCTVGSLRNKLQRGALGLSHAVVDEAHERSCELRTSKAKSEREKKMWVPPQTL